MSKLIAISSAVLLLIQSFNIGADDILQLDELMQHAQYHQQEYGDNFFVFLSKHYGELKAEHSKNHQEEQKDHEQLPFQCQGNIAYAFVFLPRCLLTDSDDVKILTTKGFNFHYFNFYSSLYEEERLQPPRVA